MPARDQVSPERLSALLTVLERGTEPFPDAGRRTDIARFVPARARLPLRRAATLAVAPAARARARRLAAVSPLRLHLGSAGEHKPGWVNVDLAGAGADLAWDLSRGVPFPADAADAIFHEHLLEHLTLREALRFTRECLRVLRPGGILRAGVPDGRAMLEAYAGRGDERWLRWHPTAMLAVHDLAHGYGHRSMWDAETLGLLFVASGFARSSERAWGEGELEPNVDTQARRGWTAYVEAVK